MSNASMYLWRLSSTCQFKNNSLENQAPRVKKKKTYFCHETLTWSYKKPIFKTCDDDGTPVAISASPKESPIKII